ncbi:PucR-like helix-turn-helix protein [Micromonospora pisi]|uniref:PucR-like helix-turn-helix protein n=1 Tax=Micromonospora pisi TaxID=589240 RepID=A0A495JN88_9ACTN|nr:helix-turn-helix domain-containing protein [Micromonospora pisi]RKR89812.1 PucR-like helix-turn-helix protein [Micromonospora pisi]
MRDLAVRLAALDAEAGAALQVIAYFDGLVEGRAGLQSIVRGAAVLAGCPARLDDDARRVHIRMLPDGIAAPLPGPADESWPGQPVGTAMLRLERVGPPGPVDAMVLERAAGAAGSVLDRTRGRAPATDPAAVELVVDASAPADVRLHAARRLGLPVDGTAYAVALGSGESRLAAAGTPPPTTRAGIGPAVPLLDLPESHQAARTALRFAAEGTDEDPGETLVHFEELGGLAVLALVPDPAGVPDVRALEHAANAAPWVLTTLHAVASTISMRAAATVLRLHHSTLQDRVEHAEHWLGWSVREPQGRLRLQLALALRRLHRHPS